MALSEKEQELLAQMEAALAADDPHLANTLRGTSVRTLDRRRATLAVLGLVVGVGLLVLGMSTHPVVSVLGFLVMLGSALLGLASWQTVAPARRTAPPDDTALLDRLEERWRHTHPDED